MNGRLIGEEVGADENVHVPSNKVPPGGGLAPLRHWPDSMPAQDIGVLSPNLGNF